MSHYDYTFKILLVGNGSVDKTAFTKRYCYNIFNPSERLTIGVDFHIKTIQLNNRNIKLQIWDVGGEERFRFLLPTYCLGATAAFILYDITNASTLDNIPEWLSIVRRRGGPIPIMLVGTNLDLAATSRQVPRELGIQIAERYHMASFVEVSAKDNINVNEAFRVLTELTLERTDYRNNQRSDYRNTQRSDFFSGGIPGIDELFRSIYGEFNPFEGFDRFGGFGSRSRRSSPPRREVGQEIEDPDANIKSKFKINEYLELRLENGRSNIYIKGRLVNQCKYLLLTLSNDNFQDYDDIESIDEAAEKLDRSLERGGSKRFYLSPKDEFWGHCSNLQAWYENGYDTRILHRNLAFPLLKALMEAGDKQARRVFKEQIALRLESGHPSVVSFLVNQGYLNYLTKEEIYTIIETPNFIRNIPNWFNISKTLPKWLRIKIMNVLKDLKCSIVALKFQMN